MFSLAYVILPFSNIDPAAAIAESVARFRRGGKGDVPADWLRFHDKTAEVLKMHDTAYTFTRGQGLRTNGGDSWHLNIRSILAEMERRGLQQWSVRFADIEPELDCFANKYLNVFERHPIMNGFGHWRNALGRWDWWELGGRFDGVIAGEASRLRRCRSAISSGASAARTLLGNVEDALGEALGEPMPEPVDVRTDANIEIVATLGTRLTTDYAMRLPGVIVLPPGSVADDARWIEYWPKIGPTGGLEFLGVPATAKWREVVATAYHRFPDHWAAAIAFHH